MVPFFIVASLVTLTAGLPAQKHGLQVDSPSPRIIGGEVVNIEDFPSQLSLYMLGLFFCSATVISKAYALTAASCMASDNIDIYELYGATKRIYPAGEEGEYQYRTLSNFWRHPQYEEDKKVFDVAVLQLYHSFTFSEKLQIIPIATSEPKAGDQVVVSGWGDTGGNSKKISHDLLAVTIPVVERAECAKNYSQDTTVTDSMICAGSNGRGACLEDNGSPLVLNGEQVGIFSYNAGDFCPPDGFPGIYANLAHPDIQRFILQYIGKERKDGS